MVSGVEDGDAVHLAFDEDDVVETADCLLGEMQVEEDTGLAVDRRLGRVEVLGAGFVVGGEGASGEGDDLAALITDGKDDAVAEFAVERRRRPEWLGSPGAGFLVFFPAKEAALAERVLVGQRLELVAEEEAGFGGEADAEAGDGFVVEAAAMEIFTGGGGLGTAKLLLKPRGRRPREGRGGGRGYGPRELPAGS